MDELRFPKEGEHGGIVGVTFGLVAITDSDLRRDVINEGPSKRRRNLIRFFPHRRASKPGSVSLGLQT